MTSINLHAGDNRESLRRLIDQGVRVHSVVCDPPYGMTSITKRFGADKAAPAKFGSDGAFARASAGFMGSKWDGTGIERDPEFWAQIYDILLPGGYVVAFSAARTGHWQACAMEMAGFVMHPFLGWVYGQGFPKAHNASKALAKIDATDEAAQWEGWAYGGQALKPALEPIYVGQKPFSEKNGALNLMKHGVGAINIDGCRVPTTENLGGGAYSQGGGRASLEGDQRVGAAQGMFQPGKTAGTDFVQPTGRHPANLLHDGSPEVVALFPESSVTGKRSDRSKAAVVEGTNWLMDNHESTEYTDSGTAARFFNSFPLDADPICYQGKATKADRAGSKHPTVKPIALMRWLCRLVTPPGGVVLDPFAGSGTTGAAAREEGFDCILMEAEEQFITDIRSRFGLPAPVSVDDFDSLLSDDLEALL